MTTVPLSSRRQTLISVTAFVGLLFGTLYWGVNAAFVNSDLQDEFESKSRIMDGLRVHPSSSPDEVAVQFSPQDMVIDAPTPTLAASELHKKLLASLDAAGGSVRSIQAETTNDVTSDGLRHLTAQISFESTSETLQKALFTLETSVPFIFVDSMVVQRATASATGAAAGNRLNVTIVASSYWKAFEAASKH